jgi:hypothetical protein
MEKLIQAALQLVSPFERTVEEVAEATQRLINGLAVKSL